MSTIAERDTTSQKVVEEAKAELGRAQKRLIHDLDTTPDDKINWSPSATSRTPVQIVAHSAMSVGGMMGMLQGKPFPFSGPQELDTFSRAEEKKYTTREAVTGELDKACAEYCVWLDGLTEEQLAANWEMPFGSFPMTSAITFIADHLRNHAGQLEYVQTIYGDHDWHM